MSITRTLGRLGAPSARPLGALALRLGVVVLLLAASLWSGVVDAATTSAAGDKPEASASKLRSAGDTAFMNKQYQEALDLFSQAIKAEPDNEKNYYKRFRVYDRLKRTRNALSDLNHAIRINPEYTSAYALRARLAMSLGRCTDAANDYTMVLKLKPSHGDAKKLLPTARECAQVVRQAEDLVEKKLWGQAERALDLAIQSTGNAPYLKMLRGEVRFEVGKYFEAIADAGDVLKIEKESVPALLLRGKAYYRTADHEMTMRHLREALKFDPEHKETKTMFKMVKSLMKKFDKAEKALARANHNGLLEALQGYKDALTVDPSNKEFGKTLHLRVCKCEAKLKNLKEASAACEAALAIDRTLVEGYTLQAEMLMKDAEESSQFEDIIRILQRGMEMNEKDPSIRDLLHRAEVGLEQSKKKNYYKILGIKRTAQSAEIKKAYRKLAKEFHPDRHSSKSKEEQDEFEAKFQAVAEAYEVLGDPNLRAKYDRGEEVFENQGNNGGHRRRGNPFGGGGFHGGRRQAGGHTFHFGL